MTTIPPIPPGTDLTADEGPRIIAANVALIVLPTVFVILRFVSRKIARAGLWVLDPCPAVHEDVKANV